MSWSYNYGKQKVAKSTDIPDFPHYAVMVFRDTHYTERGYDRDDPDTTVTVRVMDYYAFAEGDKAEWEAMVQSYFTEKTKSKPAYFARDDHEDFVFFHTSGRGKVNISIDVKVQK